MIAVLSPASFFQLVNTLLIIIVESEESVFGFRMQHTPLIFLMIRVCNRKVSKIKNIFEIGITMERILRKLEAIEAKVDGLPAVHVQVSSRFLPTFVALTKLGCGTASQTSRITGRARAFESKNLNEMHAMGLLEKKRQGKSMVFTLKQPSVFPTVQEQAAKTEFELLKNLNIYK